MMQVISLLFKLNCFKKTEERGQKKLKNKIAHNVFIPATNCAKPTILYVL